MRTESFFASILLKLNFIYYCKIYKIPSGRHDKLGIFHKKYLISTSIKVQC